jgi:signal transduction histidine kinase
MRTTDSLQGRVSKLVLSMVLLVAVVAGAGAVGVASLTDDVDAVVHDLRPAAYANIALRNDMDRAQAAARGWGLTGGPQFLQEYQRSITRARSGLAELQELTAGDDQLRRAANGQAGAIAVWTSFADAWLARQPGRVPTRYTLDGQVPFDRFLGFNDELSSLVSARVEHRAEQARARGRYVVGFAALVSLLGLGLTALLGRSLVRGVSGPLRDLERGVERLAAGELGARVSTDGPREIRRVAAALNTLAEENQRAREMEEEVLTRLRRLDRAKDEFVSTVSHELRTPLTSIAGYIELFEDGFAEDLTPQQRGMLGVVGRNVGRLRALIEDLLTLSRVEADAFRTSFELVDLGKVVSDAARDVRQTAARAQVEVRESIPAHPVLVRGDAGQLSRATLNLLSNAVKFSPRGSEVALVLDDREGQAVVSVADHGIGIPAAELATLGTRFFRASNAVEAEIGGTGLGLRIVQTIADNHGGRLVLESEEGDGTTARLLVPLANHPGPGNIRTLQEITEG